MSKLRDDSSWAQLTPDQRCLLEHWLFEENLGYEATLARVQEQFGLEATVASLGRYYRRRAEERQGLELVKAQVLASALNALPVHTDDLRKATLKLAGRAALEVASRQPRELGQLEALLRLLIEAEQNDIRRARLNFAERCFEYDATAAARSEVPKLTALLNAIFTDETLDVEAKDRKLHRVLFPDSQPIPARNGPRPPSPEAPSATSPEPSPAGAAPDPARNGH